jgi:hypothetical protein
MTPKYMSSDAGCSDVPKKNHKVFPLSEKVKLLDLLRNEKNMLNWLKSMVRTNLLSAKL